MKGAEAVLVSDTFLGHSVVRKERREKEYRISEIDNKIRFERTRREARLLHKAKLAGVLCPVVYEVGIDYIVLGRITGKKLPDGGVAADVTSGQLSDGLRVNDTIAPHWSGSFGVIMSVGQPETGGSIS